MRFLSFILMAFYLFILPNLVAFVVLPFWVYLFIFAVITAIYISVLISPSWVYVVLIRAKRLNLESSKLGSLVRKTYRRKLSYPYLLICTTGLDSEYEVVWGKRRDYLLINERFLKLSSDEISSRLETILIESKRRTFYIDSCLKALKLVLLSIMRSKYRILKKIIKSETLSYSLVMIMYFIYLPFFYLADILLEKKEDINSQKYISILDRNLFNIENKVIY